jgi:hypothetical protein
MSRQIEAYREAGCEGVVASFGTEPERAIRSLREFAKQFT